MWSIIKNTSQSPKRLICASVFIALTFVVTLPSTGLTQNLKHPPALEIFARPDALSALALASDASHAYYIDRKAKTVSLVDHDLVAKSKIEIPLIGAAQSTTSVTPLDAHHLLLSYPAANGKLTGSIVNLGTRKLAPLSYNGQAISYGRVSLYQGAMGQALSVVGQAGNDAARFDYDAAIDKTDRIALAPGERDLWLNNLGETQFAEVVSSDGQTWSLKGFVGSDWRELITSPLATAPKILGPGHDADSLYIKTAEGQIEQITLDGTTTPLDTSGKTATPIYSRSSASALGLAFAGDWPEYQFDAFEARSLPALATKTFESYRISFIDFALDPRRCLIKTEGEDDAGTYYFVDFANDEFVELGKTRPALREEWITEKEAFTYRATDGTEIKAYLTLPPGREPHDLPLVAILSDGPQDLSFDPLVAGLATRGYAVLQPNVRNNSPGDLADAVAYLKTNDIIDDKRICLIGQGLKRGDERCAIDSAPLYTAAATPEARLKPLKAVVDILLKDNAPY